MPQVFLEKGKLGAHVASLRDQQNSFLINSSNPNYVAQI